MAAAAEGYTKKFCWENSSLQFIVERLLPLLLLQQLEQRRQRTVTVHARPHTGPAAAAVRGICVLLITKLLINAFELCSTNTTEEPLQQKVLSYSYSGLGGCSAAALEQQRKLLLLLLAAR